MLPTQKVPLVDRAEHESVNGVTTAGPRTRKGKTASRAPAASSVGLPARGGVVESDEYDLDDSEDSSEPGPSESCEHNQRVNSALRR